ncbi:IclR family transcriptional regulator [Actinophytocola sp. NPDC049390]|uniref:IclR family transcriptional regulator n=1 Tax=Actinophytocola sp. NPDC049390 TaxID=3363894 RepID=UPI00378EF8C1
MDLLGAPDAGVNGDTPALRLFSLVELISTKDSPVTLQGLVEETGLPKPTLHRMLQQLEAAELLYRLGDGRHYCTGVRLRRMAENLLLHSTQHGARHAILRNLVDELGESCNITALSNNEIVYLDRVETPEPLRFYLRPGSRVPVHCSASGKIILAQLAGAQRRKLLGSAPLRRYTPSTITEVDAYESELATVRRLGYATDNEEFLSGLVCVAVLVPAGTGWSNLAVAVQAPVMRLTVDRAEEMLGPLRAAAAALAKLESTVSAQTPVPS